MGYVDAANVTDNPAASAHMSAVAGAAFVARAGIEPTLQLTVRDRNRLAITADLLGAWARGCAQRAVPVGRPDPRRRHPDATVVQDSTCSRWCGVRQGCASDGTTMGGAEIADPPRYPIGVADMPLADPYDPARLERSSMPAPT